MSKEWNVEYVESRELADAFASEYLKEGVRAKAEEVEGSWRIYVNRADYERFIQRRLTIKKEIMKLHCQKWTGIEVAQKNDEPPNFDEQRLELFVIDVTRQTIRSFKLTNGIVPIIDRKIQWLSWGKTDEKTGDQLKIVITWCKS